MSRPAWCLPVNDEQVSALFEACRQTVSEWWLLRYNETNIELVRQGQPDSPEGEACDWRLFCPRLEIRREQDAVVAMFEDDDLLKAVDADAEPGFISEQQTILLAGQRMGGVSAGYVDVRIPRVLGVEAMPSVEPEATGWKLDARVYRDAKTKTPSLTRYAAVRPRSEKEE